MKLLAAMAAFFYAGYAITGMAMPSGLFRVPAVGSFDADLAKILIGIGTSMFPAAIAWLLKYRPLLEYVHKFVGEALAQLPIPAPQPIVDPVNPVNPIRPITDVESFVNAVIEILKRREAAEKVKADGKPV